MVTTLDVLQQRANECNLCEIRSNCSKPALFYGDYPCEVLYIPSSPGRVDGYLGVPFQSNEGRFFKQIMYPMVGIAHAYGVAHTVACVPLDDKKAVKNVKRAEQRNCEQFLKGIYEFCNPKLVVAMGRFSRDFLPRVDFIDVPILGIDHPLYHIVNGGLRSKKLFGDILQLKRAIYQVRHQSNPLEDLIKIDPATVTSVISPVTKTKRHVQF